MGVTGGGCVLPTKLFVLIAFLFFCQEAAASWLPKMWSSGETHPYAVLEPEGVKRQDRIQELLQSVEEGSVPQTPKAIKSLFVSLLSEAGNLRENKPLRIGGVVAYLSKETDILRGVVPFLAGLARRLRLLFPQGLSHLSRSHPHKHLRRIQVLALLAASFFGVIPHDQRRLLQKHGDLPMNKLDFHYRGMFDREPKYVALFAYFSAMKSSVDGCWKQMVNDSNFTRARCSEKCVCQEVTSDGRTSLVSPADEIISFYLHAPDMTLFESPDGSKASRAVVNIRDIVESPKALSSVNVELNGDITLSDGELQVDFADKFVGGLSVFANHVAQEELIFALRPELLVVMLFLRALRDDEAVVIKGAESFVLYTGYEATFKVHPPRGIPDGSHWSVHGYVPLDYLGRRDTTVVVMDALELGMNSDVQYSQQKMMREILKAALAFSGDPFEDTTSRTLAAVATGKWGCVIFGGDNELKTLLQWIAATYTGRELHYKAFGDRMLVGMQTTLAQIREKFPTIKQLFDGISKCVKERPTNSERSWSLWKALLNLGTE